VIELESGQEIELTGRLRMGLGWDQAPGAGALSSGGAREVDLDASAVQFGGGRLFDIAFYNNRTTRDGSVEHLGDNTSGKGAGDDEEIVVDLTKVHPQIDTVFLLVTSYQGHSLEWIANAYCRVVDEQGAELARITLTLGVPQTGVVLARISRHEGGWTLRALAEGIAVKLPTESERALKRLL
jgi:stress response protein SCP2